MKEYRKLRVARGDVDTALGALSGSPGRADNASLYIDAAWCVIKLWITHKRAQDRLLFSDATKDLINTT